MRILSLIFFTVAVFFISCKKNNNGGQSNTPKAKFSLTGHEKATPSPITFINTSSNSNSYFWNFGDGNTSNEYNPVHTYSLSGSYIVTLKVTGPAGSDSVCKLLALEAPPQPNKSAFSYYQDKCSGTPFGISFKTVNTLSTNPVWDFGNGNILLERDPIVQFLVPGDYTIKYSTVLNGVRDTSTRIIIIN